MAVKAINKRTGVTVTADASVVRLLGRDWEVVEPKPVAASRKAPRTKARDK